MFYPAGTPGWTRGMLLYTPSVRHPEITQLELARYCITFQPEYAESHSVQAVTPDLGQIGFNSLHFGEYFSNSILSIPIFVQSY